MPEPHEYQVLVNLQTALRGMAVGSGYYYTVVDTAVKLDPNQDVEALIAPEGPRPFVVLEVVGDEWAHFEKPNRERLALTVRVHWVHESNPEVDADRMQTYFRGCADVERAITQDLRRGGLAVDTRIRRRAFDPEIDGSQVWAIVELQIPVVRTYGTP